MEFLLEFLHKLLMICFSSNWGGILWNLFSYSPWQSSTSSFRENWNRNPSRKNQEFNLEISRRFLQTIFNSKISSSFCEIPKKKYLEEYLKTFLWFLRNLETYFWRNREQFLKIIIVRISAGIPEAISWRSFERTPGKIFKRISVETRAENLCNKHT